MCTVLHEEKFDFKRSVLNQCYSFDLRDLHVLHFALEFETFIGFRSIEEWIKRIKQKKIETLMTYRI